MKALFSILILLFSVSADARDYTFYYRQTQLAEENLLNEHFKLALKHYDSAFRNYDFRFARDCFIAAQTAAYLKDNKLTYNYLSYCLQDGIKFDCIFGKSKLLHDFTLSPYFKKLYSQKDSLWQQYLKRIDSKLNIELTKRFIKEQEAKNKSGEQYYSVVEDNVWWIENLLIEGKYPGEKISGLKNSILVTTISSPDPDDTCEFASDMANVSLRHFNYGYDLLKEKLIKAMHKGQISPQELALIFIFNKNRTCRYRKERPNYVKQFIENSPDSSLIFNLPFERKKIDTLAANKNRYTWFIPRMGTRLTTDELLKKYGITVMIGDWVGY